MGRVEKEKGATRLVSGFRLGGSKKKNKKIQKYFFCSEVSSREIPTVKKKEVQ